MVSTVDARATEVGLDLLRRGGSAADAAVGANAALAVIAPHMCGMGGDVWALVHNGVGTTDGARQRRLRRIRGRR